MTIVSSNTCSKWLVVSYCCNQFIHSITDDNQLSNREFIAVMKNRIQRGLEKPKDTGFLKLLESLFKCAKETKPVLLDI